MKELQSAIAIPVNDDDDDCDHYDHASDHVGDHGDDAGDGGDGDGDHAASHWMGVSWYRNWGLETIPANSNCEGGWWVIYNSCGNDNDDDGDDDEIGVFRLSRWRIRSNSG